MKISLTRLLQCCYLIMLGGPALIGAFAILGLAYHSRFCLALSLAALAATVAGLVQNIWRCGINKAAIERTILRAALIPFVGGLSLWGLWSLLGAAFRMHDVSGFYTQQCHALISVVIAPLPTYAPASFWKPFEGLFQIVALLFRIVLVAAVPAYVIVFGWTLLCKPFVYACQLTDLIVDRGWRASIVAEVRLNEQRPTD